MRKDITRTNASNLKRVRKKEKEVESTELKDNTIAIVQGGDYLILSPFDDIFCCVC